MHIVLLSHVCFITIITCALPPLELHTAIDAPNHYRIWPANTHKEIDGYNIRITESLANENINLILSNLTTHRNTTTHPWKLPHDRYHPVSLHILSLPASPLHRIGLAPHFAVHIGDVAIQTIINGHGTAIAITRQLQDQRYSNEEEKRLLEALRRRIKPTKYGKSGAICYIREVDAWNVLHQEMVKFLSAPYHALTSNCLDFAIGSIVSLCQHPSARVRGKFWRGIVSALAAPPKQRFSLLIWALRMAGRLRAAIY